MAGRKHGNYRTACNAARLKKYCATDGNELADPPLDLTVKSTPSTIAIQAAKAGRLTEAIETIQTTNEQTARMWILQGNSITSNLKALAPPSVLPFSRPLADFGPLFEWDRSRTLLLIGETNTGKTTLAASLLPLALFTRHQDKLALLTDAHEGVILDDMSFRHLHREAQIALLDVAMPTDVHVRYKVAHLPAGLPRIITSNREAHEIVAIDDPAIRRRVQVVTWYGVNASPSWASEGQ